ncbi:MAG: CarD family transcriptional regulator [Christensenellales bacterium]|jgi:CarD family transcriptional regulator
MYQPNDTVLYGVHGVCKVREIAQRSYDGQTREYYVLCPLYHDSSVLYVPVDNKALTEKIHAVLSAEQIRALIQSMPQEGALWIEDEKKRKVVYKEILERGDRKELVGMIKALHLHEQKQKEKGRKLHMADERFFKTAEKVLYDEFALVLNIQPEQVLPFIMQQIHLEEKQAAL